MKIKLLIFFLLCSLSAFSTNYYLGAGGSNSNTGTSIAQRWLTIPKINSRTFSSGDSILFAAGQTFYGKLILPSNGVILGSYGTGKATISGLYTLDGWASVGTNLWECTPDSITKANCNVFLINNTPYAVGRTPNNSYYVYSSSNTSTLTSTVLTGSLSNMVGAEVVSRRDAFRAEKARITNQSGTTITFVPTQFIDNTPSGSVNGTANYGFFLQRYAASLDQQGEWYFNSTTNKMRLYSTVNPSTFTVKASYIDTLFNLGSHTNITVTNLNFEGAGMYAIFSYGGTNITVKNCGFDNNTRATHFWYILNVTVDNCTFNNSFNNAIRVGLNSTLPSRQINITNNTVTNTGQLIGMGLYWTSHNLKAIVAYTDQSTTSNYVNIIGNTVRNSGYMGIEFRGSNVNVRRNVVDTFCNQIDDGGAIYTFVANANTSSVINYQNQLVDSNFMFHGIGAPLGASAGHHDLGAGYYMDDQARNVYGRNNTIAYMNGNAAQWNTPLNHTFRGNTIYDCEYMAVIQNKINFDGSHGTVSGNRIVSNIMYQKATNQINFYSYSGGLWDYGQNIQTWLTSQAFIDSNWITQLRPSGYDYIYKAADTSGTTNPPDLTLAQWQTSSFGDHDNFAVLPPVTVIASPSNTNLHTNPSNNLLTVSFNGLRKRDPKNNIYDHQATIERWSSLVLIDNGNAPAGGNVNPIANAGSDQSITLPTSSATLVGSGTDQDGTIASYLWTKLSGPAGGNITSSTSATTGITALQQGTYAFQLRVTDNLGATGSDFMQIIVSAANIAPSANAGGDQSITLPQSTTTLSGSGTDPDGTIASYLWTKISGPSGGSISSSTSATTGITALQQGTYVYQLRVTDNLGLTGTDVMQVVVNAANVAPSANAGSDQSITLPTSTTTLSGSGTDPDGTIASYFWAKISGPSGGNITSVSSASTGVTALQQGTYVFQLTVTDNQGLTGNDFMQVVVNAANVAPNANAGSDQSITLPTNTTTLVGSGSDPDGSIASYAWVKIGGPSGGNITSASSATTGITSLQQGTYVYQLTVTDNLGLTGSDFMQVVVNAANVAPSANAGIDQSITLPTNTTTLNGSGTDPDGSIASYAWAKISGPAGGTITSPTSASTGISALQQGTYVYQLTVTDNMGLTGSDFIQVVVNPAVIPPNDPPTSNAGADQNITLPTNTATLSGSGNDTDGTITGYLWRKISGPSGGTITSPTLATTGVTALIAGVYVYQLRVTDNSGDTATDAMQITVNAANALPTANAGIDQSITAPTSTATLTGSGTDPDGSITGYLWRKISGPAGGTITSPTLATTGVTALGVGVYVYQLRVTDNSGDTATDAMQITVNAANVVPNANAGVDQTVSLPTSTATLVGSGTDPDGSITAYFWTKISGPSGGSITSPTNATTGITGLIQGVYIYQLRVTDNAGDTATDAMQLTVNAANTLPVANGGGNKTVTLPINSTTLFGSGTDVDGTITGYLWRKISGPAGGTIANPTNPTTDITSLIQGVYIIQLRVTDNSGDTATDAVQITVYPANVLPTSNAGRDTTITLPINTTNLMGFGTDPDGTITGYLWRKISGPAGGAITSPTEDTTAVTGLLEGVYFYQLRVTDNAGDTATDVVQVTVNPEPPQLPPVADAGIGQVVQLPTNSTTLNGSATDQDGTVTGYAWTQLFGTPNTATITPNNDSTTVVSNLIQGTYYFVLTATDNDGLTGKDTIEINVVPVPPNLPPTANAGGDLRTSDTTITLNGAGSDAGSGFIASYHWVQLSGPLGAIIVSPDSASTRITGLMIGVYRFELTVTDNLGATATSTIEVTITTPGEFRALLRFHKSP